MYAMRMQNFWWCNNVSRPLIPLSLPTHTPAHAPPSPHCTVNLRQQSRIILIHLRILGALKFLQLVHTYAYGYAATATALLDGFKYQ